MVAIIPEPARLQVRSYLAVDQLKDISISRPSSRLSWGVPVPGDPSQTVRQMGFSPSDLEYIIFSSIFFQIYVWLDALINYLTVSGFPNQGHCWPASAHIVGKDILRFHAVYWPAFLLALGLSLPEQVVSHSHWTVERKKVNVGFVNVCDVMLESKLLCF